MLEGLMAGAQGRARTAASIKETTSPTQQYPRAATPKQGESALDKMAQKLIKSTLSKKKR
tara:strand:- start:659 stop:838 length:180 start_codon:yes stop_codon:yes gene_type:complete